MLAMEQEKKEKEEEKEREKRREEVESAEIGVQAVEVLVATEDHGTQTEEGMDIHVCVTSKNVLMFSHGSQQRW